MPRRNEAATCDACGGTGFVEEPLCWDPIDHECEALGTIRVPCFHCEAGRIGWERAGLRADRTRVERARKDAEKG
jgi:hypothetical protein